MQDCHFWSEEKLEPLEKAKLVLNEDKHRQSQPWPRRLFESLDVMHMHGGKLIRMLDIKTFNSHTNVVISKVLLSDLINIAIDILSLIKIFNCSCKVTRSLQGKVFKAS